ncbi:EamA family transporter RarD [Desulfotalea psychrophila]|uniref:Related to integral membrane protein (RarD) n=1 Tax=Desulfotalea psychrophila (strain LSv54 / DSM 12343) TaxID=177439 RepID=Q6ANJ8_DESPS|nr:EamA family transporter RarD [Desulfotalea psychrophila]CAG36076.1 related to integral membrane protein (RarD) [Desulfotalea psychrophila LSv54]
MQRYFGVLAAIAAFAMWGSLPIYWKQVAMVPALEVLCHRTAWSLLVTAIIVFSLGRWREVMAEMKRGGNIKILLSSALLLAANWLLYIWAVNSGYIIEASLGYFINPLINIGCGCLFFGERLRRGQILALFIASCAVIYLTVYYGRFPWIAITLAFSFAAYAVVHKKTTVSAVNALFIETVMLFLPAVAYIAWLQYTGVGSFLLHGRATTLFLVGAGVATTIPLLCFGYAAHNLRLATLGIFQYIAPSLSLVIGIFLYGEDFPAQRMVGFCLIWLAILLYMGESFYQRNKQNKALGHGE